MAVLYVAGYAPSGSAAVIAATTAFWIIVLLQFAFLQRRLARAFPHGPRRYEFATWFRTALPIFLVEGFYFLLTHTDILVLQLFVTPDRIAMYYAAVKTHGAGRVHLLRGVGRLRAPLQRVSLQRRPRAARGLRRRRHALDVLALARDRPFVLLVLGKPILMLFGPDFTDGYPLICILAVGLLARASVGPVERLLTMLGEQRICAVVYAGAFALNLVLCLILVPLLGLEGAAIATATALMVESALLFWVTRTRLGLHVFIWGRPAAACPDMHAPLTPKLRVEWRDFAALEPVSEEWRAARRPRDRAERVLRAVVCAARRAGVRRIGRDAGVVGARPAGRAVPDASARACG